MDHALSCVRTVTVVTTLLDADAYPAEELIELRMTRWMVETNIHHLKITLGMDVLKCKTLDGVRKERLVFPAALQPRL